MLGSLMAVVKFSTSVVFSVNSMTKMTTVWLVAVVSMATSVTVTLTTEALPGTRFLACENVRTTLQQVTLCYASTPERSSYYIGMDLSIRSHEIDSENLFNATCPHMSICSHIINSEYLFNTTCPHTCIL